jgi:hypothetical protein
MLQRLFIASLLSAGTDGQSVYKDVANDNNLGSSVSALITQLQVSPVSLPAWVLNRLHPVPLLAHEQDHHVAHLGWLLHLWHELHMLAYRLAHTHV